MKIRYCTTCLFPETKPDLFFNENGVCSACVAASQKDNSIDWSQREKDFNSIIEKYKKSNGEIGYDCLIPVSGGKDSTYQAYFMKEVCGLNPLCVCFETTNLSELGQKNLDNISKMGIDVIYFKKIIRLTEAWLSKGSNELVMKCGPIIWVFLLFRYILQ